MTSFVRTTCCPGSSSATLLSKAKVSTSRVPRGYWNDEGNQRECLDKIGRELGVKELDDWYRIRSEAVNRRASFIRHYNHSLIRALQKLHPEHKWDPLRFAQVPRCHWNNKDNQREYLDKIGKELGVKGLDDWYHIPSEEANRRASFIRNHYHSSLFAALQKLHPEHNWDPLQFAQVPRCYWNNKDNQRDYLDKIGKDLRIKELDDWYHIPSEEVNRRASFINHHYNGCLRVALQKLYPEHKWDPLRFSKVPKGYWNNKDNQRDYLDKIGRELGVKELDDWYHIPAEVLNRRASFINSRYNGSLFAALQKLHPEHNWDPLRFSKLPQGYWKASSTQKQFHNLFKRWIQEHKIKKLRDRYQPSLDQFQLFQRVAIGLFGSVTRMLEEWFPETNWSLEVQSSEPEQEPRVMI